MILIRQITASAIAQAGWDASLPPVVWSPRMSRCAGLFVVEQDSKGIWRPEIRLSVPLLRRQDHPWPVMACGCNCRDTDALVRRIIEHELVHYKLWSDGEADWGHTARFRQIVWEAFGHQGIHHGIGDE